MSSRKANKPQGANFPHYPSKVESKLIRKMMVKSGETKEEVLSKKENRVIIAEELKKYGKKFNVNRLEYNIKMAKRQIARTIGKPVYSTEVEEMFKQKYEIYRTFNGKKLRYNPYK